MDILTKIFTTQLGKNLESKVRKAIWEYNLFVGNSIAIALSGGKDSLSLLFLLNKISGKGFPKLDLSAIHVEGEFSCGAGIHKNDLKNLCDDLKISFTSLPFPENIKNIDCYGCSRIRRKIIFEEAKKQGRTTIAFGHHKDDLIETLLMNLFQKGEFATLLPKIFMYHYGITLIRPLILIEEKELISFAKESQFYRITCQCKRGQNSRRKEIKSFFKELETLYPHIRKNLFHAAQNYGSDKALKIPKKFTYPVE